MIEGFARSKVADMQVHVSDGGSGWHPVPPSSTRRGNDILDIQRLRCHEQFDAPLSPERSRPIGVDLDAESVRVGEVERLTDQVIRHSDTDATFRDVHGKSAECGTIGQQNGEMIQAERAAPWPA